MSEFDYVEFTCLCPHCGKEVKDFQTKDANNAKKTLPF